MKPSNTLLEDARPRFWSHVDRTGDCWLWLGALRLGYGRFWVGDHIYQATHIAYMLEIGPIPSGLYLCHHCDNRQCVRPSHLFVGTQKQNIQDAVEKGLLSVPHPFAYGELNNHSKLTNSEVLQIRELGDTISQRKIAAMFNTSQTNVKDILLRRIWKHI